MNLKSKLFGLTAATALSLSIVTGAMANQVTLSGQVELAEGLCKIEMSQSNGDFGVWTYNGATKKYDRTSGNNEIHVSGTVYESAPNGGCDLNIQTNGMEGASGAIIHGKYFSGSVNGGSFFPLAGFGDPTNVLDAPGLTVPVGAGGGTVGLKLDSVPDTYEPDTYTGTVVFTVSNPQ